MAAALAVVLATVAGAVRAGGLPPLPLVERAVAASPLHAHAARIGLFADGPPSWAAHAADARTGALSIAPAHAAAMAAVSRRALLSPPGTGWMVHVGGAEIAAAVLGEVHTEQDPLVACLVTAWMVAEPPVSAEALARAATATVAAAQIRARLVAAAPGRPQAAVRTALACPETPGRWSVNSWHTIQLPDGRLQGVRFGDAPNGRPAVRRPLFMLEAGEAADPGDAERVVFRPFTAWDSRLGLARFAMPDWDPVGAAGLFGAPVVPDAGTGIRASLSLDGSAVGVAPDGRVQRGRWRVFLDGSVRVAWSIEPGAPGGSR